MRWVTIHEGSSWEVDLLRGALEENDIPAFSPDVNLKTLDPFITGGAVFDRQLQVPEELAGRATELLDDLRLQNRAERPPGEEPAPAVETAGLEAHGRRVCFASLFPFTAPFALAGAWSYFRRERAAGVRARNHALVVGATWLCVPQCLVLVAYGAWALELGSLF